MYKVISILDYFFLKYKGGSNRPPKKQLPSKSSALFGLARNRSLTIVGQLLHFFWIMSYWNITLHKKQSFMLSWINLPNTAIMFTFLKKSLTENFSFCTVLNLYFRSNHQRCSIKKMFWKSSQNSQKSPVLESLF